MGKSYASSLRLLPRNQQPTIIYKKPCLCSQSKNNTPDDLAAALPCGWSPIRLLLGFEVLERFGMSFELQDI